MHAPQMDDGGRSDDVEYGGRVDDARPTMPTIEFVV
jgi:hypothetical protein